MEWSCSLTTGAGIIVMVLPSCTGTARAGYCLPYAVSAPFLVVAGYVSAALVHVLIFRSVVLLLILLRRAPGCPSVLPVFKRWITPTLPLAGRSTMTKMLTKKLVTEDIVLDKQPRHAPYSSTHPPLHSSSSNSCTKEY